MKTFIIAEAACTWLHGGLEAAYRSIRAAKDCGADAWKTQWTSDPVAMHKRRGIEGDHYKRLAWPKEWLEVLKGKCDEVGIEFMVTCYLQQDIPTITPLVKRFKVSAFESQDAGFIAKHMAPPWKHDELIISLNPGKAVPMHLDAPSCVKKLHCISLYPTQLEQLFLRDALLLDGLSDHTTSVLAGAVAVGAGATILEKHVKLSDTPTDDPDYGHSLVLDDALGDAPWFGDYVANVREAEKML